jgi:hypothetical protein
MDRYDIESANRQIIDGAIERNGKREVNTKNASFVCNNV